MLWGHPVAMTAASGAQLGHWSGLFCHFWAMALMFGSFTSTLTALTKSPCCEEMTWSWRWCGATVPGRLNLISTCWLINLCKDWPSSNVTEMLSLMDTPLPCSLRSDPVCNFPPEDSFNPPIPILHRLILSTVGCPLWEYSSDRNLLASFPDALLGECSFTINSTHFLPPAST